MPMFHHMQMVSLVDFAVRWFTVQTQKVRRPSTMRVSLHALAGCPGFQHIGHVGGVPRRLWPGVNVDGAPWRKSWNLGFAMLDEDINKLAQKSETRRQMRAGRSGERLDARQFCASPADHRRRSSNAAAAEHNTVQGPAALHRTWTWACVGAQVQKQCFHWSGSEKGVERRKAGAWARAACHLGFG
jgi:hypothetical protein